jgi:hypothetical protein
MNFHFNHYAAVLMLMISPLPSALSADEENNTPKLRGGDSTNSFKTQVAEAAARHGGVAAAASAAAAAGCPYASFIENGAAPSYMAQNTGFDMVECDPNNKNCQVPTTNNQGLQTNVDTPCLEDIEPDTMSCAEVALSWSLECQDSAAAEANLADGFKCGCMSDMVQDGTYCQRTCGLCSPVLVSQQGFRSGSPEDLSADNDLAVGIKAYSNPLPRKKCIPYDVAAVAEAVRSMHTPDDPTLAAVTLDIPPTVRAAFHDAGDYNKWSATGGADGRLYNNPESWYAQSRTLNAGLVCPQKLMGLFKDTSLSPADAIQICGMVSVEMAGGPKFEDFNFEAGRVTASGVTHDGMLPGPLGSNVSLRDYFYRAGLDDLDIVTLMGGHTLGGGQGSVGSGFTGAFTHTPDVFSNDFFQNLIQYANVTDNGCDYFAPGVTPEMRDNHGCFPTNENDDNGGIMQLPTDRALLLDDSLLMHVKAFAEDKDLFFEQFAKRFKKMSELGKDVSVQWCSYD